MSKAFFITIGAIAILVGGFLAVNAYVYSQKQPSENASTEPYRGMLSGEYICINGETGDACMPGLRTDVGEVYGIDFNLMSQAREELKEGDRFSAQGLITPIENLSTDVWRQYEVQGIFSVTDSVEKE